MTQFAQSCPIDAMGKALLAASIDNRMRTFVLIDGALLGDLPSSVRRFWSSRTGQSLLAAASDEVGAVGPLLYFIDAPEHKECLPALLCDLNTGRISGSVILSDREPVELARRLSALVDVRLSDETDMVMRFFDPRVLPFWMGLLTPAYRRHIGSAVVSWFFWTHDFDIQTVQFGREAQTQPPLELPMRLNLDAENALLNACFPFTMIERIRAEDSSALQRLGVSQRYAFFQQQIARAQDHGLSAQGELEAYCCTAIEFGAAFDEDRQVRSALAGIKRGQTFDEAIATLTNDDWQRVRGVQ